MTTNKVCDEFETITVPKLYGKPTDTYRQVCLAIAIISVFFYINGFVLFLYFRSSYLRLQTRSIFLNLCCMLGFMMFTTLEFIREYIGRENISCQLYISLFYISMFLGAGSVVGYLYLYIYSLRKQRERGYEISMVLKQQKGNYSPFATNYPSNYNSSNAIVAPTLDDNDDNNPVSKDQNKNEEQKGRNTQLHSQNSMAIDEYDKFQSCFSFAKDFLNVLKFSKDGKIIGRSHESASFNPSAISSNTAITNPVPASPSEENDLESANGSDSNHSGSNNAIQLFQMLNESNNKTYTVSILHRLLESIIMPMILMIAFGSPVIIALIIRISIDPVYKNGCKGCGLDLKDYGVVGFCASFYFVSIIMAQYSIRNESDPFGVITESKLMLLSVFVILPGIGLSAADPGNLYKDYKISWDMFYASGIAYVYFIVSYYHIIKALYERRVATKTRTRNISQHTTTERSNGVVAVKGLTSNHKYSAKALPLPSAIDINHLLNEPRSRNALLEHCIDELSSENLVFVFKVRSWKSTWDKDPEEKVNRIGINIYQEYISGNAKSPINVPNIISSKVQQMVEKFLYNQKENSKSSDLSNSSSSMARVTSSAATTSAITNSKSLKLPINVFDDCEKECLLIIKTDTLPRFIKSKLFVERILDTGIVSKIVVQ